MTGHTLLSSATRFDAAAAASWTAQTNKDPGEPNGGSGDAGIRVYLGSACPGGPKEHSHAEMEIILPLGAAEFDLTWGAPVWKPEHHRLREGQIAFVGPQQPHAGCVQHSAGLTLLHLTAARAEELGGGKFTGRVVHDFARLARDDLVLWDLAHVFRRLTQEQAPRPALYLASVASIFAAHLFEAHRRAEAPAPDTRCLTPTQLRTVGDFIAAHLKDTLTTATIARQVHLSPFHFTRLFRGSTGLAPHHYLIRCRVLRAQELLRTGNFRVAEVAYETGFCDQSHLDRQFRRHFGFPPKILLKQHRAQA